MFSLNCSTLDYFISITGSFLDTSMEVFMTLVLECLVTFLDAFLSILDATVFQQKECIVNWVNTWKSFHFNPLFVALSPNHISKFDYCMFVFLLWYCKMLFFALDVERSKKYYSSSLKNAFSNRFIMLLTHFFFHIFTLIYLPI